MEPSVLVGTLGTAGLLGATHAVEPDHVAGIWALTGEVESPRLSALVGGCFAAGHVALLVVWVAVAYLVADVTTLPASFEAVGTLVVGGFLVALSAVMGATVVSRVVHRHRHSHGGTTHDHVHLHLPFGHVGEAVGIHDHDHGVAAYLKAGLVGALFTLSPPLSMMAFVATVVFNAPPTAVGLAVVVYALALVGTMALVGSGVGSLFSLLRDLGPQVYAAMQAITTVLVFSFGVYLLWESLPRLVAAF